MKFNCDLGEGLDELDALLMPQLDQASVACGGHAGDTASMQRCVDLALTHSVSLGAHPSYPDRKNFGRKTLHLASSDLSASLAEQVANFSDICKAAGTDLDYIKAHGALYNDICEHAELFTICLKLARDFAVPLMVQSLPQAPLHFGQAKSGELIFEAFADRAYTREGRLQSRNIEGAVLGDCAAILHQVESLMYKQGVYSVDGQWLALKAESICFHSDSPNILQALQAARARAA